MSIEIHRSAVVENGVEIGEGSRIGPFCHIGPNVRLGCDNVLHAGVVIDGHTTLGDGNEVFPYACLGKISQDVKFDRSWVSHTVIGSGNVFREYVTVNAASAEGAATLIGDGCLLLSYSHVAHDCRLGDGVIVSTDSKLAGHVEVGDRAVVSAKTGVVQFVRVGRLAFIGGFNKVTKDVLPFCIADGFPAILRAVNRIGLERNGYAAGTIRLIDEAFRTICRSGLTVGEALDELERHHGDSREVQEMIAFARASKIGLAMSRKGAVAG